MALGKVAKINKWIEKKGKTVIDLLNNITKNKEWVIIVRYHEDADGISSAIIFERIIKEVEKGNRKTKNTGKSESGGRIIFKPNIYPVYTYEQYREDIIKIKMYGKENGAVFLLDVGKIDDLIQELEEPINTVENISSNIKGRVYMCVIDHHPTSIKHRNLKACINPWEVLEDKDNPSAFTTGWVMERIFNILKVDSIYVQKARCISLLGDASTITCQKLRNRGEIEKAATVFEILPAIIKKHDANTIWIYKHIIKRKDILNETWLYVKKLIDEIVEESKRYTKEKVVEVEGTRITVKIIDINRIYKRTEIKSSGRIVNILFLNNAKRDNCVFIGYAEKRLILRIGKHVPKEININILCSMISKYNYINSWGGHPRAGSILLKSKKYTKTAIRDILKCIKNLLIIKG